MPDKILILMERFYLELTMRITCHIQNSCFKILKILIMILYIKLVIFFNFYNI